MRYTLSNEELTVEIESHGAELKSLKDRAGREYMWCADPKYWGRTSPVLFPIVGRVHEKEYELAGKTYHIGQHGFARNMEFICIEQSQQEIWFALEDTPDTLEQYPYHFRLEIGYRLEGKDLEVMWRVYNTNKEEMYFSIGAHPAFNTPLEGNGKQTDCYLKFDRSNSFVKTVVTSEGITDAKALTTLENSRLKITSRTFEVDALIIEDKQVSQVSLCGPDGKEYIRVSFDMPLVGIWSKSSEAPFVCIEPWCGMGDRIHWERDFSKREYTTCLEAGGIYRQGYHITVV